MIILHRLSIKLPDNSSSDETRDEPACSTEEESSDVALGQQITAGSYHHYINRKQDLRGMKAKRRAFF